MKIYVDDSKLKKGITCEDDVESLQSDIVKNHNWSQNNNMELNGTKFQVIRYGKINN